MKHTWTLLVGCMLFIAFTGCDSLPTEPTTTDNWSAERWGISWHCPDSLGYDGYMQRPLSMTVSSEAEIQMEDSMADNVLGELSGFFEAINTSQFETYIGSYMLPESFASDSIRDLAITMTYRWDSIGISNHTNDITIKYLGPLVSGVDFDMAMVDFEMTQTMVFANHWSGNHLNSVRVLEGRFPGTEVGITDSTWVNAHADSIRRRSLAVTVNSSLYAIIDNRKEAPGTDGKDGENPLYWMMPGGEYQPGIREVMDTVQLDSILTLRKLHSPVAQKF